MDYFQVLPEFLIISIISLLPTRDAARTSILSRRWRFLWTLITRLDLNPRSWRKGSSKDDHFDLSIGEFGMFYQNPSPKMVTVVNRIFASHRGSIESCRISYYLKLSQSRVPRWIDHLKQKGIQKLVLSGIAKFDDKIRLPNLEARSKLMHPSGVFKCRSLRVLELDSCLLFDASPFLGCNSLETLRLHRVYLTTESLAKIVFNCMFLERLILSRCYGLVDIRIHDANLKILELTQFGRVGNLEIKAPSLTSLVIDGVECDFITAINAPKLQSFSTRFYRKEEFEDDDSDLEGVPGSSWRRNMDFLARSLGICRQFSTVSASTFQNLQRLSINLDMNQPKRAKEVAFALRICVRLQELDITVEQQPTSYEAFMPQAELVYDDLWQNEDSYDCVAFHLKAVWIRGFKGEHLELEFARYLITRAPKLQTLTIKCHNKCSKRGAMATESLLSVPRASLGVDIELRAPPGSSAMFGGNFETWASMLQ